MRCACLDQTTYPHSIWCLSFIDKRAFRKISAYAPEQTDDSHFEKHWDGSIMKLCIPNANGMWSPSKDFGTLETGVAFSGRQLNSEPFLSRTMFLKSQALLTVRLDTYRMKKARLGYQGHDTTSSADSEDDQDEDDEMDDYDEDDFSDDMLMVPRQPVSDHLHSYLRAMTHPWYANIQPLHSQRLNPGAQS
jgi:hypothetical protein